jgi:hypothetical protein
MKSTKLVAIAMVAGTVLTAMGMGVHADVVQPVKSSTNIIQGAYDTWTNIPSNIAKTYKVTSQTQNGKTVTGTGSVVIAATGNATITFGGKTICNTGIRTWTWNNDIVYFTPKAGQTFAGGTKITMNRTNKTLSITNAQGTELMHFAISATNGGQLF